MIETIETGSPKVLGLKLCGRLHDEDYKQFEPRMETILTAEGKVRLFVQCDDFHGWDFTGTERSNGDNNPINESISHGTHVAGSIVGNGILSGSSPSTNTFPSTSYAGIAPKAGFVFQSIMQPGGSPGAEAPVRLRPTPRRPPRTSRRSAWRRRRAG